MKRKILSLFSAFMILFCASTYALAEGYNAKNPYALIEDVANDTFSHLKANIKTYQTNPDLLKKIAQKNILPYINVRYAAYKVLGPFANKATKKQRDDFTEAFTEYLLSLYAQILTQYTDQQIEIEKARPVDANRSVVSVRVDILDNKRPPITLDFKLRKNKRTGDWQGYDVHVEGVSMLDTKASEWQGQLRKNGIDNLTKELQKLAKAPIKKKE